MGSCFRFNINNGRSDALDVSPDVYRQSGALSCIDKMFKLFLDSANLECQPMMGLLQSLEEIVYDIPTLCRAPVLNVNLVWSATRRILDWIQRQRGKARYFIIFVWKSGV